MENNETPPPFSPPPVTPPPLTPPPVISSTAPAAAPKRGRGWMVFSIILLVLLVLSVFVIVGQFARNFTHLGTGRARVHARVAGPRLEEVILEDNDPAAKIAVVDVTGIISSRPIDQGGFTMVDLIKAQLKNAAEDRKVKSVILKVDSPGGEVLASDEISEALKAFQRGEKGNPGKPVIVSMGNLAASGGYYVSAPCKWIVANDLTITGSIEVYGKFKGVVADGRKNALAENWASFADGRVLSGTEAKKLGFVDQLGNFDDAVTQAKKFGNISGEANLIQYQQRYDIGDFFRMFGETKSESRVLKVDVGLDMPKLMNGQLYFLSPLSIP
jgi:protease-4